ncbi:type IV secretory system conjugative DNA transfer family protein, partial [Salmonella enterica subsp. enterica serovar Montevideo]|nr:type IV secretory system conjugative DNA transfer family protein [Salmonella enterica subsp. enterica serovar Montevideo]
VLEPRSNTMKMGLCKDDLAPSLGRADEVFLLQPPHIPWQVADSVVVNDTKFENFYLTAGFRKACGQKVFRFSPERLETHHWNP